MSGASGDGDTSERFSGMTEGDDDIFISDSNNNTSGCTMTAERKALNEEIVRSLASDFIRFKIHGMESTSEETENPNSKLNRDLSVTEKKTLDKARQILRRTSVELEKDHEEFFGTVAVNTRLDSAEQTFRDISEEVLSDDKLNWGRVVSLFVYGGRVAEEFWRRREEDKVEEVEEWLSDCVNQKEEWISQQGGWDNFIEFFNEDKKRWKELAPQLVALLGGLVGGVIISYLFVKNT